MHLSTVLVCGYRSLYKVEIPISDLTACIGPNGSGKSSLISAIHLFFVPSLPVQDLDFWHGTAGQYATEIMISVTFGGLTESERVHYQDYLADDGSLSVIRQFEGPGKGSYLCSRNAIADFSLVRSAQRAHKDEYNRLVSADRFEGLQKATSKEDAFRRMVEFERSNPDLCETRLEPFEQIDELLKAITPLFIGAFENPSKHVDADGRGAVTELLRSSVNSEDIASALKEVSESATTASNELLQAATGELRGFQDALADMLPLFAPGCELTAEWEPLTAQNFTPRLGVKVKTSDGLVRPVHYQGHGVQRALMYAALTALASSSTESPDRCVLLLIEEPEAFQHPLSCRVLARTLIKLASRNYQIAYTTHSSLFVQPANTDGLRIFRRVDQPEWGASTSVKSLSDRELLAEWERVFEGANYTIDSVNVRLQAHLPPRTLEGLFAELCILVEGDEDEAAVRAAALDNALDLDANGVAVIQTNGKTGMPNVLAFLGLAGVNTYPIFDLDRHRTPEDQGRDAETQIARSLSLDCGVTAGIHSEYSCWETNLTKTLKEDLGESYDDMLRDAAAHFGYEPKRGRKVPAVIGEMVRRARAEGIEMTAIDRISNQLATLTGSSQNSGPSS